LTWDGNGKISQDELRQVLGMPDVEETVGKETVQALLDDVDLNGDGEIDFDEFMVMMRNKDPESKSLPQTAAPSENGDVVTSAEAEVPNSVE